jgi:hypothetical protein
LPSLLKDNDTYSCSSRGTPPAAEAWACECGVTSCHWRCHSAQALQLNDGMQSQQQQWAQEG